MNLENMVAIGSMSLALACLVWLALTLWHQQRELRRKERVELIERRILGDDN